MIFILWATPAYPELLIFPELGGLGFGNPAREARGVQTAYSAWLTDSKAFSFGYGAGSWGLGAAYMDFGAFEFQDESPDDAGGPLFRPYAAALVAQAGFQVDSINRAGLAVGVLQERVFDQERWEVFMNLGLLSEPLPWLSIDAFLRNFGLEKLKAEALPLPTEANLALEARRGPVRGGLSYSRVFRYGSWFTLDPLGTEVRAWIGSELGPVELGLAYSYGREVDPFEASLGVSWGSWRLGYRLRPTARGFDWLHFLNFTFLP